MDSKYIAKAHNMLACTRLSIDECIALMQGAEGAYADALYKELEHLGVIRDALVEMLREEERK
jgi:hypothetical protein